MITSKTFFALVVTTLITYNSFGQGFEREFKILTETEDTAGQISLLREWERSAPRDPELFVSWFNYYVMKSKKKSSVSDRTQSGENSVQLSDSSEKSAGSVKNAAQYDENYLKKGFGYIDKGISFFPDRLDMRFGKIYILGQTENYKEFTREIIKTIEFSNTNKNVWLWTDSKPQEHPKEFMLSAIQSYVLQIYNIANDSLLENMKKISEAVLKYYPDHVESLSNLSVTYMVKGDFDNALITLLKAEKYAPADPVVLGNIAYCYYEKNDKQNAIKYYELTAKYGDEQAIKSANEKLEELRKK